ncbi:MAG: protein O-mannosyl-transferase family [Anaerolineae bacterium]
MQPESRRTTDFLARLLPVRFRALLSAPAVVCWVAAGMALAIYLSTLQWGISSGSSPYTTDVGEFQNALPRWGTLHFTGYPLYSLLGSLLVSLLRIVGVAPAAGSSLVSALWGSAAVGMLAVIALELKANRWAALGAALLGAMSLSFWIDSSLAEVHTMTMTLTLASLLYALRFRRTGARPDLLWLAAWLSQGVAHQRAVALLAPAVVVLIWPHWRMIIKNMLPILALGTLAFLTYLYLPMRAWMGADWTFGQVGTWKGFWAMIPDIKASSVIVWPNSLVSWWEQGKIVCKIIVGDLPWPIVVLGLIGLWLPALERKISVSLALTLIWIAYSAVALVTWEGRISDALLAVLLPVAAMASLGIALLAAAIIHRGNLVRVAVPVALAAMVLLVALHNRPQVLAITRDATIQEFIAQMVSAAPPPGQSCTVLVPWGKDYWALKYVQEYQGEFAGISIVDHNANIREILSDGSCLLTPAKTLYTLPLSWWEDRLGEVHLYSAGAGIIRVAALPQYEEALSRPGQPFDLGNGVIILEAKTTALGKSSRLLSIYWQAEHRISQDYSVAVHILAESKTDEPGMLISQSDRSNPVEGWYATSRWTAGEVIRDDYLLEAPEGTEPAIISVSMYRQDTDGEFINTPWLEIDW